MYSPLQRLMSRHALPGVQYALAVGGVLLGEPWQGHAGGSLGHYGEWRLYPRLGAVSVLLANRAGLRDRRWLDDLDAPLIRACASSRNH